MSVGADCYVPCPARSLLRTPCCRHGTAALRTSAHGWKRVRTWNLRAEHEDEDGGRGGKVRSILLHNRTGFGVSSACKALVIHHVKCNAFFLPGGRTLRRVWLIPLCRRLKSLLSCSSSLSVRLKSRRCVCWWCVCARARARAYLCVCVCAS